MACVGFARLALRRKAKISEIFLAFVRQWLTQCGMDLTPKTHRLTIRVSKETAAALRHAARNKGRALSDYVRLVITKSLRKGGTKQ